jgi:hypothetical protein
MKKVFLAFFSFFCISNATEVNIENLKIKNLPHTYFDVFKDFFKENIEGKKENISLDIDLYWLSYSYNLCISIKEKGILVESLCTTSNYAENLRDDLKNLLKDSKFIYLKDKDRQKINLVVISKGNITEKKARLISSNGDYLSSYKTIIDLPYEPTITIGGAVSSIDLVILNEISASFILKKMLYNYKIDKIYITN